MESTSISYQPKFGRVLIEREVNEKIGSIIVPDAKRHAYSEGTIIALGESAGWATAYESDGTQITKQIFKVGDKVLFGRHAGAWLDKFNGVKAIEGQEKLFICQDEDILAVISEETQAQEMAA